MDVKKQSRDYNSNNNNNNKREATVTDNTDNSSISGLSVYTPTINDFTIILNNILTIQTFLHILISLVLQLIVIILSLLDNNNKNNWFLYFFGYSDKNSHKILPKMFDSAIPVFVITCFIITLITYSVMSVTQTNFEFNILKTNNTKHFYQQNQQKHQQQQNAHSNQFVSSPQSYYYGVLMNQQYLPLIPIKYQILQVFIIFINVLSIICVI